MFYIPSTTNPPTTDSTIWPYSQPYITHVTYPPQEAHYPIQIRKVSNGYVLKWNNEEFVYNEIKDLLNKIKELK